MVQGKEDGFVGDRTKGIGKVQGDQAEILAQFPCPLDAVVDDVVVFHGTVEGKEALLAGAKQRVLTSPARDTLGEARREQLGDGITESDRTPVTGGRSLATLVDQDTPGGFPSRGDGPVLEADVEGSSEGLGSGINPPPVVVGQTIRTRRSIFHTPQAGPHFFAGKRRRIRRNGGGLRVKVDTGIQDMRSGRTEVGDDFVRRQLTGQGIVSGD